LLLPGHFPSGTEAEQKLIQAAHQRGLPVVPVPGPSLPITALVISGLPADGFVFLGILPSEGAKRRKLLASIAFERRTLVVQDKGAHLPSVLSDLDSALDDRPLCIVSTTGAKSSTVYRGTLGEAAIDPPELSGDGPFVLVLGGHRREKTRWSEEHLLAVLQARLAEGQPAKEIARALAAESGWPRREIYRMAVDSNH
jgi:16S rRNA (cytidine1402-2'-O)-methyltransferase